MARFKLPSISNENSPRTMFAVPTLFLLLSTLSAVSVAQSSIALVQSTAVQGSNVTSVAKAFPQAETAGNLIIAFVRASTTSQTVSVSDSAGNHYVSAVAQAQTVDGHQVHIFYAANVVGGSNTVTARFSGTNPAPWMAIYEYRGLSTTNPLLQTAVGQGSSNIAKSSSLNATAGNLVFAAVGLPRSSTVTVTNGPGYAIQQQAAPGGSPRGANESLIPLAGGSVSGTFNLSSSANWSDVVAVFSPTGTTTVTGSTGTTGGSTTGSSTTGTGTTGTSTTGSGTTAPATVGIVVSPASATLQAKATQQFVATVTGNTNTTATWSVNGIVGGNSTVGTISANGLYTAPASAPSSAVTVTATSAASTTASASSSVTVTAAPAAIAVTISPVSASVKAGATQQFAGTVTGTTTTTITWQVNGIASGNSTVGTISTTGLYTAPASAPSSAVTVTAVSYYDPAVSANATVSVSGSSTPAASGKAYYVSPSGSDSNPGTASAPFLTIQQAANVATAGYTVYVAPGTYNVSSEIVTGNNGTASAPITFESTTQFGAKIVTSSANNGLYLGGAYNIVEGFDISASGNNTTALLKMGASNTQAIGNRVHDMGASSCVSGAGIQIGSGTTAITVAGNYIYNIGLAPSAGCNQTHGIYVLTSGNTIQSNVIFNCEDLGIQIDGNGPSKNIVTNNTIFGNWRGIVIDSGDGGSGTATGNIISNNIIYNNLGAGIYDGSDGPVSGNTISYNLIDGNSPNTSLSGDTASNTIAANPSFVNYTGNDTGNYQLSGTGSPAYHAGTHTDAPVTDFAGNTYNNPPSIGAYEYIP